MQDPIFSIAPGNESGASSDNSFEVTLADDHSADLLFQQAKEKLLDVNRWHEWSGGNSAVFQLTDENGRDVDRAARNGDHFRIDIPGPGSITGKGYDWVQVEAIAHTKDENMEAIALRVRPADDPRNDKNDIAHFFSKEASSTFSVTRTGKKVIASVQGRNEKPNTETGNVADKIRNTVVAAGAIIGLNKPQWKNLVKGLLNK